MINTTQIQINVATGDARLGTTTRTFSLCAASLKCCTYVVPPKEKTSQVIDSQGFNSFLSGPDGTFPPSFHFF